MNLCLNFWNTLQPARVYASQVLIITVCKPKKLFLAHAEELTVYPIPSWIADIRADEGV